MSLDGSSGSREPSYLQPNCRRSWARRSFDEATLSATDLTLASVFSELRAFSSATFVSKRPTGLSSSKLKVAGGITNLMKYWPLSERSDRSILLLHGFAQASSNDYVSHLRLWDFTWAKMKKDIWSRPSPKLFARRFQFTKKDYDGLRAANDELRNCLTLPITAVLRQVFGYGMIRTQRRVGARSLAAL